MNRLNVTKESQMGTCLSFELLDDVYSCPRRSIIRILISSLSSNYLSSVDLHKFYDDLIITDLLDSISSAESPEVEFDDFEIH